MSERSMIKRQSSIQFSSKEKKEKKQKQQLSAALVFCPQKICHQKKKRPKIAPPGDLNLRDFSGLGGFTVRRIIQQDRTHKDQTPLDGAPETTVEWPKW